MLDTTAREAQAEVREHVEQLNAKLNGRLDKLDSELATFQQGTQKRLDEIHETVTNTLAAMTEASDKRIDTLQSVEQAERTQLREQVEELDARVTARLDQTAGDVTTLAEGNSKRLNEMSKTLSDAQADGIEASEKRMESIETTAKEERDRVRHVIPSARSTVASPPNRAYTFLCTRLSSQILLVFANPSNFLISRSSSIW